MEKLDLVNFEIFFKVFCENFEVMNLDKVKKIGLCIDGVSVMIGKKDGLSVKLK